MDNSLGVEIIDDLSDLNRNPEKYMEQSIPGVRPDTDYIVVCKDKNGTLTYYCGRGQTTTERRIAKRYYDWNQVHDAVKGMYLHMGPKTYMMVEWSIQACN